MEHTKASPDRVCPHKLRVTHDEWNSAIRQLSSKLSKAESVGSTVYYAYPFREICPDCQYVVFSQGPDSLKEREVR